MTVRAFRIFRILGFIGTPLIAVAIAILSLAPSSTLLTSSWLWTLRDKGAHALAYAALAFFLFCMIAAKVAVPTWSNVLRANGWRLLLVLGLSMLMGSAIEIIQPYFGRAFEILDIVADAVGALIGLCFAFVMVTSILQWEASAEDRR